MTQIAARQDDASSREPGDLPTWLTVVIVLLCVGGGGFLVFKYFTNPPKVVTVPLSQSPRPGDGRARNPNRPPPQVQAEWTNDVRPVNNGFQARSGPALMWVRKPAGATAPVINVDYRQPILSDLEMNLRRAPALAKVPEQAQRLKLTPEQVEKLKAIRPLRGMKMSADEGKQVTEAWAAFESAAPDARQVKKDALLKLLADLGAKNLEPTKAAATEMIKSIRGVLNEEQQKLLESGNF
jgi:hypothetical protein